MWWTGPIWPRDPTRARIGGDDARLPLAAARPAGARRRRGGRPPGRPERAGGPASLDARRRGRPRAGGGRSRAARRLRLPAHRHAGRAAPRGLGRDPGRARLHAAELRVPRPRRRVRRARRDAARGERPVRRRPGRVRRARVDPVPLLSDEGLALARELRLPTFEAGGLTLYRRLTFVARDGRIEHVVY